MYEEERTSVRIGKILFVRTQLPFLIQLADLEIFLNQPHP